MGACLCRKRVLCEEKTHSNQEVPLCSNGDNSIDEFANRAASNRSNRQDVTVTLSTNQKVTRSKFQVREDSNEEHVNPKTKTTSKSTDQGTTTSIFLVEEYRNESRKENAANSHTIKVPPWITIPPGYFDSNTGNVSTRPDSSKLTKPKLKLQSENNYVKRNIEGPRKLINRPGNFTNNQSSNYGDERCESKKRVVQSHSHIKKSTSVQKNNFDPNYYPAYSEISVSPSDVYRILPVSPNELRIIKSRITNKHIIIDDIRRIENEYLESSYHIKKMQKLKFFNHIDELELFHVAKLENADTICRNNFNWRFTDTKTGHKFGQGVYFSCNAMYAANYLRGVNEKVMFIAKVLVGKKCFSTRGMNIPEEGYDTCGKNQSNILVVKYGDDEFYPAFKIKFHILPDYVPKKKGNR